MANLIFDKAQIEATIDKIVDRTMRMDMTWDWPCGVAYYGICEAYEVTKNERYLAAGQGPRGRVYRAGPAELDGQHLLNGALPDHPV